MAFKKNHDLFRDHLVIQQPVLWLSLTNIQEKEEEEEKQKQKQNPNNNIIMFKFQLVMIFIC